MFTLHFEDFLMFSQDKSNPSYLSKYYIKKITYKFLIYYAVFIGLFTIASFIDLLGTTYDFNTLGLDKYFIILLTYPLFIIFVYFVYIAFFPIFLYEPSESFITEIVLLIVLSIALKLLFEYLYKKIIYIRNLRATQNNKKKGRINYLQKK